MSRSRAGVGWVARKGLAHFTLVKVQLISLLPQASKVSFWFNAKVEQVCETCWREKKERKERPFGYGCDWVRNTLEWRAEAQRHSVIARKTQVRASGGSVQRNREKDSKSAREWKRKRHFSFFIGKINWWSSFKIFEYYNYEELEYSERDFAIDFAVRLYLLLEIYLLYI